MSVLWLWKREWLFLRWDHRAGIFRAHEQVMTGYKRVSHLLNYVLLVLLLQPWVSCSIPSVNTPVRQGCCLDQGGGRCHSLVVLFVGRCCTGKILLSFLLHSSWLSSQLTVL